MKKISISPKLTGNQGFIFIDMIIAILLISVALVPILGMFIQAVKINAMAKDYTIAANLAQKQLELLKTHSPDYWNGLALPCTIPWQDTTQLPSPPYVLTTNGSSLADKPLVQVTVIVTWQEGGQDCNLEFVTFYPTS